MKEVEGWLAGETVSIEPANAENVNILIKWTLDPVAQGPYKQVPSMTPKELQELFLHSLDRHYYLIRRVSDQKPLGRFYYRAWNFDGNRIDWELNIFIAESKERGKGYGTEVQKLISDHLLSQPETRSIFAYTLTTNIAEQRALEKAGFILVGLLPHSYYRVPPPPRDAVLYVKQKVLKTGFSEQLN